MSSKKTRRSRVNHRAEGPLRAVAYVRLSRHKAGESKTDRRNSEVGLDTQRAGCERAIAALGGTVVAVEEDVISGDRLDRPGLWRAIERIVAGEANALIVYSLDRFGRDQNQQGVAVIEIKRAGGRLLSATENLEEGPMGDFMRSVYGLAAALELSKIRERTSRAFDAKFRTTARYKPSMRPPYGYRKVGVKEATTYEIEPAEAAIVRRIFEERAAGASLRRIAVGLDRDGIPTPAGGGVWGQSTLNRILDRPAYATGEHECWRTATVRDTDGVPFTEDRPAEDRYIAHFPPLIDPTLDERARATAERNVWRSRRDDRPGEFGIGRYGFFRCSGCGRALSVTMRGNPKGRPRYVCGGHHNSPRDCQDPASISVHLLDGPVWWWVQSLIEDPSRVDAWRVVHQPDPADEQVVKALAAAEKAVAQREAEAATLLDNLGLLSGPAASAAADRLNALYDDLAQSRAGRDAIAEAVAHVAAAELPVITTLEAVDALAVAVQGAIDAMLHADPTPERTHTITVWTREGSRQITLPDSWKAKQAALSALGVTVVLAREDAEGPRWVAELRLPGGTVIQGQEAAGGWFRTVPSPANLFHSSP
jgi:site-specific DNA recombinase